MVEIVKNLPINNLNLNIIFNPETCKLEVKRDETLLQAVDLRERKRAGRPRLLQELQALPPEDYFKAYHRKYYHDNKERFRYKKGPYKTCEFCGSQVLRLSRHYNTEICRRKSTEI